jgi:hypothetical protein
VRPESAASAPADVGREAASRAVGATEFFGVSEVGTLVVDGPFVVATVRAGDCAPDSRGVVPRALPVPPSV